MQLAGRSLAVLLILTLGCGGSTASPPVAAPAPQQHPLAPLATTGAIVTPTYAARIASDLSWSNQVTSREILRALDEAIGAALAERGLRTGWVLPAELALSHKRNPTYAPDPYALAEEPLRAPAFVAGSRLAEPLASQLRTMIALHEDARAVLLPIELRFDRSDASTNAARATLRLALIDPRFSEARWVGIVQSDITSSDPQLLARSVARGVAELVASR